MQSLDAITLPLADNHLIEASAGTGKTFTIAILYVRLVLGLRDQQPFSEPLSPPQILVTTFTKAAVEELRERISARMSELARCFAEQRTPEAPLDRLYAYFPDQPARQKAAFLLNQAVAWMDEAAIYTIHGFCQRALSEHAFHSQMLFEQQMLQNTDELIAELIRDYWRVHGYALPNQTAYAQLFAECAGGSPEHLYASIARKIRRERRWVSIAGQYYEYSSQLPTPAKLIGELIAQQQKLRSKEAQAKRALQQDLPTLTQNWLTALPGLSKTKHKEAKSPETFLEWLAQFEHWAQTPHSEPPKAADFEKLIAPTVNKNKTKPDPVPALAVLDDWLIQLRAFQTEKQAAQKTFLAHAILWVEETLSTRLDQHQQLSFDDLLLNMHQALSPDAPNHLPLRQTLRRQFPVALIDEFQDTDALQLAIFNAIYDLAGNDADADPTTLLLIGDPKQAIYGFRGADIYSYLAAREQVGPNQSTLDTNFRSTDALVDVVNQLFLHAEQGVKTAFAIDPGNPQQSLSYQVVHAKGKNQQLWGDDGQVIPAATLWHEQHLETASKEGFEQQMAALAAEQIAALLTAGQNGTCGFGADGVESALSTGDIAVLVRTKDQANRMKTALNQRGVPNVFLSENENVFDSQQATDVAHWLYAMYQPERSELIRAAISTPSLGLDTGTLAALLEEEQAFDELCQFFLQLKQDWRQRGVLAAMLKMLHHFAKPLNTQAERTRILTNIMHLGDWLNHQSEQIEGQAALIQHYQHTRQSVRTEELQLRLEEDANLVRIITIHKAKGLQFPVVFLPFAASLGVIEVQKQSDKPLELTADDLEKRLELAPTPADIQQHRAEAQAEDMRLLYVALTRAEYALYIGAGPVKSGNGKQWNMQIGALARLLALPDEPEDAAQQFLPILQGLAAQIPGLALSPYDQASLPGTPSHFQPVQDLFVPEYRQPQPHDFIPWWMSSFSALSKDVRHSISAPEDARGERRIEPDSPPSTTAHTTSQPDLLINAQANAVMALPRGANLGNLMHDLIERLLNEQSQIDTNSQPAVMQWLDRQIHPLLPSQAEQIHTLAQWLYDLIHLPLPTDVSGTTLTLAGLDRLQTEMEFWFACHQADISQLDGQIQQHIHPGLARPMLAQTHLNGMLKGFIDLSFEYNGRYYLVDWKTNFLGDKPENYSPERLTDAVLHARYDLQYSLYSLALHRHLAERLPDYAFEQHFGGVLYVFLRGIYGQRLKPTDPTPGVYFNRPEQSLINAMDQVFNPDSEVVA